MILSPNLVIADRYRLERQIGRGGMGSVWLAHHMGLDIPCAVKFIEGEYAALPEAQARFVREAKAAAQLRSPHVVQILDHGVWQGTPYMAMELLEGEDLGKRLTRIGRMSPQDVCVIITQVSRALTKAHAAGVVHRDLQPDNIYLVHDDDREIAKVLDFGIAKAQGGIDGSNTKTGAMLGTPYYMSPEQAQGIKAVDGRSDLWSLAVITYQCLTGRLPFESEALGDLLFKIFTYEPALPSQVAPDLPPAFDDWWRKAGAKQPDARFQTAKEFSDRLHDALGEMTQMEMTGRQRAQKIGGATALMQHVPNTPNPYISPAQTAHMSTPNPVAGNPAMWTPQNAQQAPVHPPMMMTPPGAQAPPGTFSGVDAPPEVPRKGPPVVLLAALAGLLVVGIGLTTVAMVARGKSGTAAVGSSSSAPTASVATVDTIAPTATTSAAPPADPTPTATTTAAAAADSASAQPAHTAAAVGHRPPTGVAVATAHPTATATATATVTAKPAGTPGGVTPHGLGF